MLSINCTSGPPGGVNWATNNNSNHGKSCAAPAEETSRPADCRSPEGLLLHKQQRNREGGGGQRGESKEASSLPRSAHVREPAPLHPRQSGTFREYKTLFGNIVPLRPGGSPRNGHRIKTGEGAGFITGV